MVLMQLNWIKLSAEFQHAETIIIKCWMDNKKKTIEKKTDIQFKYSKLVTCCMLVVKKL